MSSSSGHWMARFESEQKLLEAIRVLKRGGATDVDAATPTESDAVLEALELKRSQIPTGAFFVAACLGVVAWWIQWWTRNQSFASNVGARPNVSSWADLPIIFETTVLGVAVSSFVFLLVALGLPRLRHPWFGVERFGEDDAFWLAWTEPVEAESNHATLAATLWSLGATAIAPILPEDAEADDADADPGSSI